MTTINNFDRTLLGKLKHQIKEGKFPVAYWAIERLLEYIDFLEKELKTSKENSNVNASSESENKPLV